MQLRINIPPLTRVLLALLAGTFVTYQIIRARHPELLVLIPQLSIFYPWVYITATFAEQNIFTLLITGGTILYGGKYLERAWGTTEFGKFVLIVTVIPYVAAAFVYILLFVITRTVTNSWVRIQGSVSLQGAFLVAFKQLVPEHTVTILKGIIKIRVKHSVSIFLIANTLSGIILGTDTALALAWSGVLVSWIYLRFYKRQPDLSGTNTGSVGIKGDASETFAFAYFWPDVIQPPIAAVADGVYNALVALRLCTPFSAEDVESSNEQATSRSEGGLPSLLNPGGRKGGAGKREEAERRRALALKALDQRLHAATANKQQPAAVPTSGPSTVEAQPLTSDPLEEGSRVDK